ncbi:hypothetical protein JCM10450v2_007715 [Rhodotorula kratochvilovae]
MARQGRSRAKNTVKWQDRSTLPLFPDVISLLTTIHILLSTMPPMPSSDTALTLVTNGNPKTRHLYLKTAYFHVPLHGPVYVAQPPGYWMGPQRAHTFGVTAKTVAAIKLFVSSLKKSLIIEIDGEFDNGAVFLSLQVWHDCGTKPLYVNQRAFIVHLLGTCVDLAFAAGFLGCSAQEPREHAWRAVEHFLRYLARMCDLVTVAGGKALKLQVIVNPDWAGNQLLRRSTSSILVLLTRISPTSSASAAATRFLATYLLEFVCLSCYVK